jgi:hypothetical protein
MNKPSECASPITTETAQGLQSTINTLEEKREALATAPPENVAEAAYEYLHARDAASPAFDAAQREFDLGKSGADTPTGGQPPQGGAEPSPASAEPGGTPPESETAPPPVPDGPASRPQPTGLRQKIEALREELRPAEFGTSDGSDDPARRDLILAIDEYLKGVVLGEETAPTPTDAPGQEEPATS